ncbi:MAG: alpha/beta hydrolase-fold protein [Ferruginibacter sp.]
MEHKIILILLVSYFVLPGCKTRVKEREDSVYSRHLQRHVKLTVITTTMPDNKEEMNLLLMNNGQDLEQLDARKIIDSLYKNKLIQPLLTVGIHGYKEEYGFAGLGTTSPQKYNDFIRNELYPFIKKKAVTRKFKSITVAGCSLAGVSAFDIAWNNADKISKAGIISPELNFAGTTGLLNNAIEFINASRKRPHLQFWIYAAENGDTAALKNTTTFIKTLESKSNITPADIFFSSEKNGSNNFRSWRNQFAAFLLWAFAK